MSKITALISLLVCILLAGTVFALADDVSFQDPAVEAELKRSLKIFNRPLTYDDLLQIEHFSYDPYGIWGDKTFGASSRDDFDPYGHAIPQIQTLEDLAHCKNLTGIALYHQPITDLSPLSGLTGLQSLHFDDCPGITDLSPLSALPNLYAASFVGIGASDFGPVLSLPSLRTFYCHSAADHIDLSALSQTDGLSFFGHRGKAEALDYTPLMNHKGLSEISVVGVSDDTLAALLSALPSLTGLEIQNAAITSSTLSIIAGHNISSLTLINCPGVTDWSPLARLENLWWLRLNGCEISDLAPLVHIKTELSTLDLRDNPFVDITPLSQMPKIHELHIADDSPYYTLADVQSLLPETITNDGILPAPTFPGTMQVIAENRLPLSCEVMADGGFLLSGLAGEDTGASITSHLLNYLELSEEAFLNARHLHGYVAAYDADGSERWAYHLPDQTPYQKIAATPIHNGEVLCRVFAYQHANKDAMWGEMTDAFILSEGGQLIKQVPWIQALFGEQYGWTRILPDGILAIPPFDAESPMPYTLTLTFYDFDGQIQWQTTPSELNDYFVQSVIPVTDGYIGRAVHLSAFGGTKPETDTHAFRLDSMGNLLWTKPLIKGALLESFMSTKEGRILASSTKYEHGKEGYLTTFAAVLHSYDENGHLEWSKDYEAYYIGMIFNGMEMDNGTRYILGSRMFPAEGGGFGLGYAIVTSIQEDGTPMGYMPLPRSGNVYFQHTLIHESDTAYVIGSLPELGGKDRWYILPLDDSLFTGEW